VNYHTWKRRVELVVYAAASACWLYLGIQNNDNAYKILASMFFGIWLIVFFVQRRA
jgi:hypothetical protein